MYFVSEIRICPYAHIVSLYAIELLHWMLWYTMKNRDSQGISFVQISLENWETFILELFQWVCCSLWDKIQNVVVSKRINSVYSDGGNGSFTVYLYSRVMLLQVSIQKFILYILSYRKIGLLGTDLKPGELYSQALVKHISILVWMCLNELV